MNADWYKILGRISARRFAVWTAVIAAAALELIMVLWVAAKAWESA